MTEQEKLTLLQQETFTVDDLDTFVDIMSEGKIDISHRPSVEDFEIEKKSLLKEMAYNRVFELLKTIQNHIKEQDG